MAPPNSARLLKAAKTGVYPPRTTVTMLANCRNNDGETALHLAVKYNTVPPGTTPAQLAACNNAKQMSALDYVFITPQPHLAEKLSLYELLTLHNGAGKPVLLTALNYESLTPQQLAQLTPHILAYCKDAHGNTGLHYSNPLLLPRGTTAHLLQTTTNNTGTSAWKTLQNRLVKNRLLEALFQPPIPSPEDFGGDVKTARMIAQHKSGMQQWLTAVVNRLSKHTKKLWAGAKSGKYPPGTTADMLANTRGPYDYTALHLAVRYTHLPPGTSRDILSTTSSKTNVSGTNACYLYANNYLDVPDNQIYTDDIGFKFSAQHKPPSLKQPIPPPPAQRKLWDAAKNGSYPPNTTALRLRQCQNIEGYTALHLAARHGFLPKNTTIADLFDCRDLRGNTPLHEAADANKLPPYVTTHDLIHCINNAGQPALHQAVNNLPADCTPEILSACHDAYGQSALDAAIKDEVGLPLTLEQLCNLRNGQGVPALHTLIEHLQFGAEDSALPQGITGAILAASRDPEGNSALHLIRVPGYLPHQTTETLLKATKNNEGLSAWDRLRENWGHMGTTWFDLPNYLESTPPEEFQGDIPTALMMIDTLMEDDPATRNSSTIWLAKLLAARNHTTPPAPPNQANANNTGP